MTSTVDRTGTKAVITLRLPHVRYLTQVNPPQEDLDSVNAFVFDVTKETDITPANARRIKSMTVQYKNIRIDTNSSLFAHAIIYVDGIGRLRKKLVEFAEPPEIQAKKPLAERWIESIKLPPETEAFVKVRSSGNFTMALSTKGELWTRGWTDEGLYTPSEEFSVLPRFHAPEGIYNTTLGPARVRDFAFDGIHVIIIFDNGAVWAFGSIQEFCGYHPSVPSDGLVELTDSSKMKPRFEFDPIVGHLDRSEGPYGIFGKYKVVKYFKRMFAFLTEDGIPIIRVTKEIDHKNTYWYCPIDINQHFGGQKIVNMNHHLEDLYITENGESYSFWPDRYDNELEEAFSTRKANRFIGFDVRHLKASFLCRHDSVTLLLDDGKLLSLNLQAGHEEEDGVDVSEHVVKYSKDEEHPEGMIIKWYAQAALSCYFLFE